MIEIDMKMPSCCDDCFALDEHGDYPYCLISRDQRGYNFDIRAKRMPSCPLKEREPVSIEYGWVCPKCGSVYGPNVSSCWHCTPQVVITCTY